jgi:hypothetical protein
LSGLLDSVCDRLTHHRPDWFDSDQQKTEGNVLSGPQWDEGKPLVLRGSTARRVGPGASTKSAAAIRDVCPFASTCNSKFRTTSSAASWSHGDSGEVHLLNGPTLIPAHLFPRDREDTAAVDWEASALRSSGHFFSRIRVTKPQWRTARKKQSGPASKPAPPSATSGQLQLSPRHLKRWAARGWMNR